MPEVKVEYEAKSVTMYPIHWETVDQYARAMGYGSTSAALRRIVDEWVQFKNGQLPLMPTVMVDTRTGYTP